MTLTEALTSGRRFRKVETNDDFIIPDTVMVADLGSQYELEPELGFQVTEAGLAAAWNASVPASGSVALANESAMFRRFIAALRG